MAFLACASLRQVIMLGVKIVRADAFNWCADLTDMECGKLELVGVRAFYRCKALRSINLPLVEAVEERAFKYCTALTDAKFGNELGRIEECAFLDCPSLGRITIPLKDGILTSDDVFQGCGDLKHLDLVEGSVLNKTAASLQLEEWRVDMNEELSRINQILPTPACSKNDDVEDKTRAIRGWITSVLRKIIHYKTEHQRILDDVMDEDEGVANTLHRALPQDFVRINILPFLELPSHEFELREEEKDGIDEAGVEVEENGTRRQ